MKTIRKIIILILLLIFSCSCVSITWAENAEEQGEEKIIRSVLGGSEEFSTTGVWNESNMLLDDGTKSLMCNTVLDGEETAAATFQPTSLTPGLYVVWFYVPYNANSDTSATVRIANGSDTEGFTLYQDDFILDEVNNANQTDQWVKISSAPIYFAGDGKDYVQILRTSQSSKNYTRVGCVKFEPFSYEDEYIVENPQIPPTGTYTPVYPTTAFTGTWIKSSAAKLTYKETENATLYSIQEGASVKFYADLIKPGLQKVWFFSPDATGQNDPMVNITIYHNGVAEETIVFDQQLAEHRGQWVQLTTQPLEFTGDGSEYVEIKRVNTDVSIGTATRIGAVKFDYYIEGEDPPPVEQELVDIIVDNTDSACTFEAPWSTSTASAGYHGTNYALDNTPAADVDRWAKWTPDIVKSGEYNIYMCWPAHFNRAAAAPLEIKYDGGIDTSKTVNQTEGDGWIYIGTYPLAEGKDNYVKISAACEGYTIADAVKFEPVRTFEIEGYDEYQVFQREIGTESKRVTLSVQNPLDDVAKIQLSVIKMETGEEVIPWTDVAVNPEKGMILKEFTVPQGGWYNTRLRAYDMNGEIIEEYTSVKKWGVGIVILCAGQSNMAGQGTAPYTVADDLVANYNKSGHWEHLNDPYSGEGGSLVPALGNALVKEYGLPVAFVPTAVSGSGLCQYSSGAKVWETRNASDPYDVNTYYGSSLTRARDAGGVELIVWNQGETDGKYLVSKERYKQGFMTMIQNYRTDLYADIPIFLCQIGTHDPNISNDAAYSEIRSAQDELDNGTDIFMAATAMEFARKDTAHYTTAGLNVIGERVANAIMYYYGDRTYYRGPKIIGASFVDNQKNKIDVHILHRGGTDITPDSEITGFSVSDDGQDIEIQSAERQDNDTIRLTMADSVSDEAVVRYLYGLNPPHTNVVKDNSAMQLPLETTISDIPISKKRLYTEGLQCYANDALLSSGETLPVGSLLELKGSIKRNPNLYAEDKMILVAALYDQSGQLLNCKKIYVDFSGTDTADLEEDLFLVPDMDGCGLKIFFWQDIDQNIPLTDDLSFMPV